MAAGDHLEHVAVDSAEQLHEWMLQHHDQTEGVWFIRHRKGTPDRYFSHDRFLDELIAFGWTDGIRRRLDDRRHRQLASPRRSQPWAKSYKDRAERLVAEGAMQPSGQASMARAKETGDWDAMNEVDALIMPDDLAAALSAHPPASVNFDAFPPSIRRSILRWIASARTPATRQKRLDLTAVEAQQGLQVKSHG